MSSIYESIEFSQEKFILTLINVLPYLTPALHSGRVIEDTWGFIVA